MAKKRKFVRSYPNTWSIQKIADFMADCRRAGAIPRGVKPTSKKKRGGMIEVTWKWEEQ